MTSCGMLIFTAAIAILQDLLAQAVQACQNSEVPELASKCTCDVLSAQILPLLHQGYSKLDWRSCNCRSYLESSVPSGPSLSKPPAAQPADAPASQPLDARSAEENGKIPAMPLSSDAGSADDSADGPAQHAEVRKQAHL